MSLLSIDDCSTLEDDDGGGADLRLAWRLLWTRALLVVVLLLLYPSGDTSAVVLTTLLLEPLALVRVLVRIGGMFSSSMPSSL